MSYCILKLFCGNKIHSHWLQFILQSSFYLCCPFLKHKCSESSQWLEGGSELELERQKKKPYMRQSPFEALSQPRVPNIKFEKGKMTSRQPLCQLRLPLKCKEIAVKCNLETAVWCLCMHQFGLLSSWLHSSLKQHFVFVTNCFKMDFEKCKVLGWHSETGYVTHTTAQRLTDDNQCFC